MVSQGRLIKVMFALVAAMTGGALLLLALEGKPIKPMAFSLSSQTRLSAVENALGTEAGIDLDHWKRIEISYQPDYGRISPTYGLCGELASHFHFVIADDSADQDGQIYASHRWTKQLPCLGFDDPGLANTTIRICLISQATLHQSSPRQARQLELLVSSLAKHCRTEPEIIWIE